MIFFDAYAITPIALVLIILILIFTGVTRKKGNSPNDQGWLPISMIALGIILGNSEKWLGYLFFGIGAIVSIVELLQNLKNKESEKTDN